MDNFYLYTETAYHHQGDMEFMKGLIDASKEAGAHGIKFQVMTKTEDFISTKHSAFSALDSYCFNLGKWEEIFDYTVKKGLDIIMMPLNCEAFALLKKYEVKYLDIHSVSFYDSSILGEVKKSGLEIILGVGGRNLEEIIRKKEYFGNKLKVLMVGFQAFPSKIEDVKIGKIPFLKKQFPDLLIGYADHSSFDSEYAIKSNEYARLLGATIFEKHITTEQGVERVDYSAAISAVGIISIVEKLKFIDDYILTDYSDSFSFTPVEVAYRERQVRCVASRDIKVGTIITPDLVSLKLVHNPEQSFSQREKLIGKRVSCDVVFDEVFNLSNIKDE